MDPSPADHRQSVLNAVEIAVRLVVVGIFAVWCFHIIQPFVTLIVWGGVMAVAVYPLFLRLSAALGGRHKVALAFIVLLGLSVVLAPVVMISDSLVSSARDLGHDVEQGTLAVAPPPAAVAEWPIVGKPVHDVWQQASLNLELFVREYQPQMKEATSRLLSALASAGGSVMQFVLSLLVSAMMLANAPSCIEGIRRFGDRLMGSGRGAELATLSAGTVRSVATGVLGVAFIQAVLAALGLIVVGVPAAGVWALLVLLLAIAQMPPIIVLLPVALWVFGSADSQLVAWGFLVWAVLVSVSDMVLKPMMLGRGVDVPMPVILLGAIGGMVYSGIIGLFLGAVILALSYRLFTAWLELDGSSAAEPPATG